MGKVLGDAFGYNVSHPKFSHPWSSTTQRYWMQGGTNDTIGSILLTTASKPVKLNEVLVALAFISHGLPMGSQIPEYWQPFFDFLLEGLSGPSCDVHISCPG